MRELTQAFAREHLPKHPATGHKGTFGKVLLVCGSPEYPGSAWLAGNAAARSGAGLVTLAASPQLHPIYASSFHEATFLLLTGNDAQADAVTIINKAGEYRAIVMGCGLGISEYTVRLVTTILAALQGDIPHIHDMVLDADALNILAKQPVWWSLLPYNCIITPHKGELQRLMGTNVPDEQEKAVTLIEKAAERWKCTIVAKNYYTIIAEPYQETLVWDHPNPALATAGSGDVLAGIIGGLLAQGCSTYAAAACGVYLHGTAAELAAQGKQRVGMVASDFIQSLPSALAL